MRKFLDFKLLVIVFASFVFVNCNSDELNEDLPNEQVIENITGASFGKYQQLNLEEALGFVNDIKLERPSKGGGMGVRNADSDFLVGVDAGSLAFDAVEGTELKIPRLKARLKSTEVESSMFLIKVQDSTLGFLMNIVKDKDITDEGFSGIIGITDLDGKFINGYRVKNGAFISQFVVAKNQKPKDSIKETKSSLSYTTRTFLGIGWMSGTIHLEEVTVYASEEPSGFKEDDTDGLDMDINESYLFGVSFGGPGGGGGSSSSSGDSSDTVKVFPCDDPINGCNDEDVEDDKIDVDELEGKALCVYNKMVAGNNTINKILENFQDGNKPSQFNLKFIMSTELDNNVNATTATPKLSKIPNTFVIKINQYRAENVNTMLTVARTILHEGIHARLWEFVYRKEGRVSKDDFPGIYEYRMNYEKNWDHQQMAAHYRGTIAKGLKQFDNGRHSDAFYDALAWEGLSEVKDLNGNQDRVYTEAWKKLSPSEQKSVLDIITNHKKNGSKNCN